MSNAELIKVLRYCGQGAKGTRCYNCPIYHEPTEKCFEIMTDAADALEVAEKRIAELEAQLPKDGEWISEYDGFEWSVRCSVCGEEALIKEGGSHDHAYSNYCPNCGVKMKGEDK